MCQIWNYLSVVLPLFFFIASIWNYCEHDVTWVSSTLLEMKFTFPESAVKDILLRYCCMTGLKTEDYYNIDVNIV